MGSHSVTCHQVNTPHLKLSQAGRYSVYLPRRDERLSWPWCWLYTEMVYLSTDSHPS